MADRGEYEALKRLLTGKKLAPLWPSLKPMEKLLFFKLLKPAESLKFFQSLRPDDKYLLLCGRDPGALAPLLEGRPARVKRLFKPASEKTYGAMLESALR